MSMMDGMGTNELAEFRKAVARLPLTMRPSVNGQLAEWATLFGYERGRVREFLSGVTAMTAAELEALTEPLRKLEGKMGLDRAEFHQNADSMENASLLARNEFYGEWREQVRRVYAAIEARAREGKAAEPVKPRVVLTVLPASLPYEADKVWKRWKEPGIALRIEGDAGEVATRVVSAVSASKTAASDGSDLWLIDTETKLAGAKGGEAAAMTLSWAELDGLRAHVLERVNTVPRSIEMTDQILATIRAEDMSALEPAGLKESPQLRRFLIDLYLSGNGALIFSNAFVQWAASEALRRARPQVLVARFGMRQRPKPFTGIAIFENQERISKLPAVDDPKGSAVDAAMLARYVYLSARRYPEGEATAYVVVAESAGSALLLLPEAMKKEWAGKTSATPGELAEWLGRVAQG